MEHENYIEQIRKRLKEKIPEFESSKYEEIVGEIKKGLLKEESDFIFVLRGLKVLILGDWRTEEQKTVTLIHRLHGPGRVRTKNIKGGSGLTYCSKKGFTPH